MQYRERRSSFSYIFYALLISLSSCKPEYREVPADIIPMDKMALILADVHLADAVAEFEAQKGGNEMNLSLANYDQIFKNNNITRQDYIKSHLFYEENPKLLNKIYDDVVVEMSKREERVSKKNE